MQLERPAMQVSPPKHCASMSCKTGSPNGRNNCLTDLSCSGTLPLPSNASSQPGIGTGGQSPQKLFTNSSCPGVGVSALSDEPRQLSADPPLSMHEAAASKYGSLITPASLAQSATSAWSHVPPPQRATESFTALHIFSAGVSFALE